MSQTPDELEALFEKRIEELLQTYDDCRREWLRRAIRYWLLIAMGLVLGIGCIVLDVHEYPAIVANIAISVAVLLGLSTYVTLLAQRDTRERAMRAVAEMEALCIAFGLEGWGRYLAKRGDHTRISERARLPDYSGNSARPLDRMIKVLMGHRGTKNETHP